MTQPTTTVPTPVTHSPVIPSTVAWLGYGGLLPFVFLAAAAALDARDAGACRQALLAYGAVILSFVGALHWGFAMTAPDLPDAERTGAYVGSIVPSLIAWTALLLPYLPTTVTSTAATAAAAAAVSAIGAPLLLILGFLGQYARDVRLSRLMTLPPWYRPLRLRLTTVACLCIALGGFAARPALSAAQADTPAPPPPPASAPASPPASLYRQGRASPDGIGKFYDGREIAQVMGFAGAAWLERPTREQEERPDLLVDELRLRAGLVVADVGAGSGYVSRRLAARVAPGKVFAVDVQPQMIDLLHQLSLEPGMSNIVPILAADDDVKLPPQSVDLAIMVDVYHELAFPYEVMRSLVRALKPGGRMVFVEYRGEDPTVPIKELHKMREAQLRREMQHVPLVWERTSERLPLQHIVVFRKSTGGAP